MVQNAYAVPTNYLTRENVIAVELKFQMPGIITARIAPPNTSHAHTMELMKLQFLSAYALLCRPTQQLTDCINC